MRAEPSTSRRSCSSYLVLLSQEAATAETGGNEYRTRGKQRQQIGARRRKHRKNIIVGRMASPTLFLIDGSSQMYRAYHAFRGRGLSNQEGRSTHAVYVFVTMLRKLIADHKPTYLAASFDLAGPTFRDEIAADYKANRVQMPDDLVEQINWVHEACEAMGVPILTVPGLRG